jgi:hypothetical protein
MPTDAKAVQALAAQLAAGGQMIQLGSLDLVRKAPDHINDAARLLLAGNQVVMAASVLPAVAQKAQGKKIGEIMQLGAVVDATKAALEVLGTSAKPTSGATEPAPAPTTQPGPSTAPATKPQGSAKLTPGYL